jgi:hypothetical protein
MYHTPPNALAPTSGQCGSDSDSQLPRGECGFILPEPDPETGKRQRCMCRTFWLDRQVPGSRCECGHAAWNHEREPVGSVTMDEHLAVVEKLKAIETELRKERTARENMERRYNDGFRSVFHHMASWVRDSGTNFLRLDDKIESVMDKTHDNVNELDKLRSKIEAVDDAAMELENKVDKMDIGRPSRSLTPLAETSIEPMQLSQLPIRDKKLPDRWSAWVIFVPSKEQKHVFPYDSAAFKRCESRNLHQELHFKSRESQEFITTVEKAFAAILRGRAWMPMMCYRESNEDIYSPTALRQLPPDQQMPSMWSYDFLESQCLASDKMQGDCIYIALQLDTVTWNDIKLLPAATPPGVSPFVTSMVDQTFWQHDDELDGQVGYKSLDSLMQDYGDPPPYASMSSRVNSTVDPDGGQSPLEVLASASLVGLDRTRTNSTTSFAAETASLHSSLSGGMTATTTTSGEDEHRDKRTRLPSRGGAAFPFGTGPSTSQPGTPSGSQTIYLSGRSKRKVPFKQKDPARNIDLKTPLQSFLHRHNNSKGKEAEDAGP